MKYKTIRTALVPFALFVIAADAQAQAINVVATTPDLAAIAKAVGGDLVDVHALAKATEDPHFVDAKPSHIVTLNRADMLVFGGAELESGWLPPLLQSARNPKIAGNAPGHVVAADGIKMMDVPSTLDRAAGDVHARGNPHFLLDPHNAKIVAANIAERMAQVAPAASTKIRANNAAFAAAVDAKLLEWQRQLAPFNGAKIVTYHRDFIYLADRFNLDVIETLEPKPGIAPSPAHIARVIASMKAANARVILVQPFQNRRTAETVARQADAIVLDAPQQPGAAPNTDTYIALMDHLVKSLAAALQGNR